MKPKMIIDKHGTKTWGINGLLHRTDGPAVEHINGFTEYSIYGEAMTEQQWLDRVLFDKVIIKEF